MLKKSFKIAIASLAIAICANLSANYQPLIKAKCYADNQLTTQQNSSDLNINAKAAYLIDYSTGTQIYSYNADDRLPIASMTKLATLAVIFDQLEKDTISLDQKVVVSKTAADTEGSSAFLDEGSAYSVSDLIKTIVVVSANDSCVALAEHISGSEQLFAKKMNEFAQSLGLNNTCFENSTGLPASNHYSSAKDIAKIYQTVCDNKTYIEFSKIWTEDFIHPSGRKTGLVNTNRLIKTYDGCDSGKTGHTNEAKYCITASASRGGMRLITVVIGAPDSKIRFNEAKTMFNYGFANYQNKPVVNKEIPLVQVKVQGAKQKELDAYSKDDYVAFIKKGDNANFSSHIVADQSIKAPISAGDKIGTVLILDSNNIVIEEIDLIAKENIPKIKFEEILQNIYTLW